MSLLDAVIMTTLSLLGLAVLGFLVSPVGFPFLIVLMVLLLAYM